VLERPVPLENDSDRTTAPLSLLPVSGSNYNNGDNGSISEHKPKVGGYIRTICAYGKGATTTRCIVVSG
jgi:hypothetical protein